MDPDHLLEDTTEVVTEEEFRDVCCLDSPRSYWGVAPTGPPHLGYYRVLEKQQALLEHGFDHTVLLADLHAYLDDEKCPWGEMDRRAEVYQTVFELLGLDNASFIRGSSFQRSEAYVDDLYRALGMVTGNRAERAASEVVRGDAPTLGSLTYPVMQSLDCKHLNVDLALGGSDQRHVYMLTRELLPKLGGEQVCFMFTPLGIGPDAEKMHAGQTTRIELWASPEQVAHAIDQAYCPPDVVERNPVLEYATHFVFPQVGECHVTRPAEYGGDVHYDRPAQLVEDFRSGELHPADLKQAVATGINEALQPVREYFQEQRDLLKTFDR